MGVGNTPSLVLKSSEELLNVAVALASSGLWSPALSLSFFNARADNAYFVNLTPEIPYISQGSKIIETLKNCSFQLLWSKGG